MTVSFSGNECPLLSAVSMWKENPFGFSELLLAPWLVQVFHLPQGSRVVPQAPSNLSVSKHSRDDCHCFWSLMTSL